MPKLHVEEVKNRFLITNRVTTHVNSAFL